MKRNNQRGRPQEKRAPINDRIRADEVRLIDADGEQVGVVSTKDALVKAEEAGLDLVQISNADPIVCKIMDYGKFLFDEKKQKNLQKKKQKQIQVKEVKFRPGTDEGDYQVKLRNLTRFIEGGDKGKVTLRFRGREMAHQDIGRKLMERIAGDLSELVTVESFPKMEGRQMIMILAPKKK
ncbi:MAG: translation initiation factor IF-3 [Cobetia sp.]|uniref:Translation initiation factor IF-3 n=1 Tax=Cobetia amphilecti TaxID=1055104 RepID=A0AAP4TZH8_9GAMM|nr:MULTISPECIES: translation initiation factor IF-3 [Cobetia]AVV35020.1 translation initiation factor IF-3 [Halomonas sp. SF2003]MBR9756260.1 translation initiation factor IF-3 [Gammaproteobacteria bacterium]MBS4153424.1 translation initiation factor IF-3 [Cobetia sp. MC34]MCK8066681.1 translation initiation factor IF-3 [Cobetia sp. 1CM21F]NUJ56231.1 translation initiation factor IF-3 [Cobetia marina]TCJ26676.1 translation initiation factor IF-3 [Halomonas sp. GDM18]